ncbi:MAG: hypothetical protein HKN20_18755 [Gemmatimonadetes bacterium]|nr:hypothetical protein [Gemmatimonadota bacterium]
MIAQQVANKAARDALFLSQFAVDQLPPMLMSAAIFSIVIVYFASRAMIRWSPGILTPALFLLSALLVTIEFGIAGQNPKLAAVLLYLHVASIGSILISGFWSVVNERFDPRTAKRRIGRIAGGATLGGLLGGLLAERMGATLGVLPTLPVLAVIQIACAVLLLAMRPKGAPYLNPVSGIQSDERTGAGEKKKTSGLAILMRVAYIRNLGLLVLLGNIAATLIDYVFKAQAAATLTDGDDLMRFFAVFYTLVSLVTFAVQTGFTRRFLEGVDPSRSVAMAVAVRPGFVILGALTVIPFLSLATAAVFRGLEAVLQSSFFRSGYELLFAPIIPEKKRATKPIVDVGFDRMGDAIGGGIVRLMLFLPVGISHPVMLLGAALVSVVAGFVATTMNRGRAVALEKSLLSQKGALDGAGPDGFRSDPSIMQTLSGVDLSGVDMSLTMNTSSLAGLARDADEAESAREKTDDSTGGSGAGSSAPSDIRDPLIAAIVELRSGNAKRIRTYIRTNRPLDPHLAAHVIPLLAWDEVSLSAGRALAEIAPAITGQLVDRLLDPKEEFAIRRRIPRLLTGSPHEHAVQGLLGALSDKRFEVRFQSGRALVRMKQKQPEVRIDRRRVFDIVIAEAKVDRRVWESHRLLDTPSDNEEDSPIVDKVLRERTNRSMEHVFTILSLVLPREPLRIAFRGLYTSDRNLRGTALEYLESVLPEDVRLILWPFLEGDAPRHAGEKSRDEIMKELLESNQSIEINLNELRKKHGME